MNTIDSPINYPCPTCLRPRGEACIRPLDAQDLVFFHLSRRATRMAALARKSAPTADRRYVRGNLNHGDRTEGHRVTYIKRPDPTLWMSQPVLPIDSDDVAQIKTSYQAYKEAVQRAVDLVLNNQGVMSQ